MSNPTVSSEIEKILQKVVYNAVKLSRLYELEAEYVPDYSEALSKLEELIVRARIDEVNNVILSNDMDVAELREYLKKRKSELKALSSSEREINAIR